MPTLSASSGLVRNSYTYGVLAGNIAPSERMATGGAIATALLTDTRVWGPRETAGVIAGLMSVRASHVSRAHYQATAYGRCRRCHGDQQLSHQSMSASGMGMNGMGMNGMNNGRAAWLTGCPRENSA